MSIQELARQDTLDTTLSKKVQGRMRAAFDSSQLQVVGGQFDGKPAKSRHYSDALRNVSCGDEGIDTARFNVKMPFVTERLLGVRSIHPTYIEGIGDDALENLPQTVVDLAAKGADASGTVMRIVYGATTEMPFRALSYPLPALTMMEEMQLDPQKGIEPPQLQIVFATSTSATRNGIDVGNASEEALKCAELTRAYVQEHFPNIAHRVAFFSDRADSDANNEIERIAQSLSRHPGSDLKDGLQRRGEVFDLKKSLEYGAAHVLFHDISLPDLLTPLFPDQADIVIPSSIINIGGKQEQFFYGVRRHLRDQVNGDYTFVPTIQLFTMHHVPPYYMARGGDLSIDTNAFSLEGVANAAARDLRYLQDVTRVRRHLSGGDAVYA